MNSTDIVARLEDLQPLHMEAVSQLMALVKFKHDATQLAAVIQQLEQHSNELTTHVIKSGEVVERCLALSAKPSRLPPGF